MFLSTTANGRFWRWQLEKGNKAEIASLPLDAMCTYLPVIQRNSLSNLNFVSGIE